MTNLPVYVIFFYSQYCEHWDLNIDVLFTFVPCQLYELKCIIEWFKKS